MKYSVSNCLFVAAMESHQFNCSGLHSDCQLTKYCLIKRWKYPWKNWFRMVLESFLWKHWMQFHRNRVAKKIEHLTDSDMKHSTHVHIYSPLEFSPQIGPRSMQRQTTSHFRWCYVVFSLFLKNWQPILFDSIRFLGRNTKFRMLLIDMVKCNWINIRHSMAA